MAKHVRVHRAKVDCVELLKPKKVMDRQEEVKKKERKGCEVGQKRGRKEKSGLQKGKTREWKNTNTSYGGK